MEREPFECCAICGKELYDGDEAYATTTGGVSEELGGFEASLSDPWLTVACPACGARISDAVGLITAQPDIYTPSVFEAAPKLLDACTKAFTSIGELLISGGINAQDEAELAELQDTIKTAMTIANGE